MEEWVLVAMTVSLATRMRLKKVLRDDGLPLDYTSTQADLLKFSSLGKARPAQLSESHSLPSHW